MAATNFKHHTFANFAMLFAISSIAYFKIIPPLYAMSFVACYIFATIYSPDVDMAENRNFFKNIFSKPSLTSIWKFSYIFWWPYGLIMSHRGISHIPIFGTLTRIIYLSIIFAIAFILTGQKLDLATIILTNKWLIIWGFFGWAMADIAHIFLDHVGSALSLRNILILGAFAICLIFLVSKMNLPPDFFQQLIKG